MEELVAPLFCRALPSSLICHGLLTYLPREHHTTPAVAQDTHKSHPSTNPTLTEEPNPCSACKCSTDPADHIARANPSKHLTPLKLLEQQQPSEIKSHKKDSGVWSGQLDIPAQDNTTRLHAIGISPDSPKQELGYQDSHTNSDSGVVLLHGHQFSQEQSKPVQILAKSHSGTTMEALPLTDHSPKQSLASSARDRLLVCGREHKLLPALALPSEKLVAVCQQQSWSTLSSKDKLVMAVATKPHTGHKNEEMGCDRRHSDIRLFTCNMPTA